MRISLTGLLGPPGVVKNGIIHIASKTQIKIIPGSIGATRYWEFNSWDRFRIPKPFARIEIIYGSPLAIPANIDALKLEKCRLELEKKLKDLDQLVDKKCYIKAT